jgi:hypothetical protein
MSDEHKSFKSKTVELFGNKYEVSNKSSSLINNNFMLCIGFIKYNLKKINKIILKPIINTCINIISHDYLIGLSIILCLVLFLLLFVTFIITFAEIDIRINTCDNNCETYKKYCDNYMGNKRECIRNNIYYYQVFFELFKNGLNWCIIGLYYLLILGLCIAFVVNIAYFIFQIMVIIYNKTYNKITEFNEKIPEFELV